ncbi:hypothetical protein J1N35_019045 [Gossypium stocksii]|uniref:CCHC-type domain-containing protein n=1 Tax=Gossypium stocksii TaxID=47602 RepID=A0A9D3VSF1_9ROSI|nr:hypothetical protein J1N35_019045 [Gossypium stocksii]
MENFLGDIAVSGNLSVEETSPKNVRFRGQEEEKSTDMLTEQSSNQNISWKDMLLWTMAFDPTQAFASVVMAWIRFPALPSYLYNHKIITEIRKLVGQVVKPDMNTDNRTRGRFARLAVYVNLDKPLVSQILINGQEQKVEYESLSTICFHCGRYGHVESICNFKSVETPANMNGDLLVTQPEIQNLNIENSENKDGNYGPWMIAVRKSRRKSRSNLQKSTENLVGEKEGSQFHRLEKGI